jgi:hypothetical protein
VITTDHAAFDRIAILKSPETTRRKIVCVKSLPRAHCCLHLGRARRRELIITIIGTIPATIITGTLLGQMRHRVSLSDLGRRASRTQTMSARRTGAKLMRIRATGARVPEDGLPLGAAGICAVRSEPIRVPNTTSRDPGRTTAATPAVPRWARLSSGVTTSARLSVRRTVNGSSRAGTTVMRFELDRDLSPVPLPSVTLTLHSSVAV